LPTLKKACTMKNEFPKPSVARHSESIVGTALPN
jgi:hypothetical protein